MAHDVSVAIAMMEMKTNLGPSYLERQITFR